MAAPGGKFFIQDKLDTPAPHHASYQQLWETKWKAPVSHNSLKQSFMLRTDSVSQCKMGVYPFMFGSINDFEPIVESIVQVGLYDLRKRTQC
jgi:hypothetical protein